MVNKKKKRRLKKRVKWVLFLFAAVILFLIFKWIAGRASTKMSIDFVKVDFLSLAEKKALKKYSNAYHLEAAQEKGLKNPIKSKQHLLDNPTLIDKYKLVKIDDNRYYEVPGLLHSLPYLKSDAKNFLDDLGRRFQQTLNELGLKTYRFSVTSVLRTQDDQKGLRKTNVNATDNDSAHYFGLTFDLSQTRFFEKGNSDPIYSYRLRNLLLRELIIMQEEGRCYVLLENQTKCIHITVR